MLDLNEGLRQLYIPEFQAPKSLSNTIMNIYLLIYSLSPPWSQELNLVYH